MARMSLDVVLDRKSSVKDLLSLLAFSLTFLAGKNSLVETVLCSSEAPGNTVSTTIAAIPEAMCSSAVLPPSAAAAVNACSTSMAPTIVSRAKSFSNDLTAGRLFSSDSAMASRTSCSVAGIALGVEQETIYREFLGFLNSSLGKNVRILVEEERGWKVNRGIRRAGG